MLSPTSGRPAISAHAHESKMAPVSLSRNHERHEFIAQRLITHTGTIRIFVVRCAQQTIEQILTLHCRLRYRRLAAARWLYTSSSSLFTASLY